MSKNFSFPLDEFQCDWIFRPMRSKRDSLILLMKSVKLAMISNHVPPPAVVKGNISFHVGKMNRIFYVSRNKSFSIVCPFYIDKSDGGLAFNDGCYAEIDSKVSSDVIAVLEHDQAVLSPEFHYFVDHVFPFSEYDSNFWQLLRRLMLFEDGYIRYDHDPVRASGSRHPLHHLDVFYESNGSFKLGLDAGLDEGQFRDVLDLGTDCYYAALKK